jgi:NAD(P)-dependent dehydrogenase (short-subunit alcohol dehydrogenase family)
VSQLIKDHGYSTDPKDFGKTDAKLVLTTYQVDLFSVENIQTLFKEIKADFGNKTPDILISNAGYGKRIRDIWDIPVEEFDYTLNINLRASFLLVKGCVEQMRDQKWGRIVFISSIAALGGGINGCRKHPLLHSLSLPFHPLLQTLIQLTFPLADYAASKGGLTSLMKNLATRLGPYNISVNDVAPAMIGETGMIPNSESIPDVKETIPLGRLGEPEEVGRAVAMMVRTGYCTGQSLLLSGGLR